MTIKTGLGPPGCFKPSDAHIRTASSWEYRSAHTRRGTRPRLRRALFLVPARSLRRHTKDEWLPIQQLQDATAILFDFLACALSAPRRLGNEPTCKILVGTHTAAAGVRPAWPRNTIIVRSSCFEG